MRYLGSKIKLLSSIEDVIDENNIEGETFADLFGGTGCVGDYFKDRYRIIAAKLGICERNANHLTYVLGYRRGRALAVASYADFAKDAGVQAIYKTI